MDFTIDRPRRLMDIPLSMGRGVKVLFHLPLIINTALAKHNRLGLTTSGRPIGLMHRLLSMSVMTVGMVVVFGILVPVAGLLGFLAEARRL